MQFRYAIFVGALAALASWAIPALAGHADAHKGGEPAATSSGCSAQQRSEDGTWSTIPCQELNSPAQMSHKSPPPSTEEQAR